MKNPFRRKKKEVGVGLEHPVELLTEEEKKRLTPVSDFTPENMEDLRLSNDYFGGAQALLQLTGRYATLHCKIRFECLHKGDIAACFSCLSEQILVPDMIKVAGKPICMWPAKR